MTDPPGLPSVLGIESVEWFAQGGENVTVQVTGRWRRRRPAWSAQPVLVVEAAGRRFRFTAMPEPPSLTGTGPGMWRINFAVPAALAPELGARTWLQVGAVVVPLPAAAAPLSERSGGAEHPVPVAREAATAEEEEEAPAASPPSPELEAERARRRAREAEEAARDAEQEVEMLMGRVRGLEAELTGAREDAERLSERLAERERDGRAAEQRAHAEQALRRDLARQLAARDRGGEQARAQLSAAEERVNELERELQAVRRRGDEAEQVAAAAAAARQRAEERAQRAEEGQRGGEGDARDERAEQGEQAERVEQAEGGEQAGTLDLERALMAREAKRRGHLLAEPPPVPATRTDAGQRAERAAPVSRAAETEPAPRSGTAEAMLPALRRELQERTRAEAALRARMVQAEARLGARVALEQRTAQIVSKLRQELDGVRSAFQHERQARLQAERRAEELVRELEERRGRTFHAHQAIAELRLTLESLSAEHRRANPAPDTPEGASAAPLVEPDRLNEARQRLREAMAPPDQPPRVHAVPTGTAAVVIPDSERTERAWLEPVFRRLTRSDPAAAGRLLVELLPAQREVFPQRLAYDLVFGAGRGSAQVTVSEQSLVVRHADSPRPTGEVDFQVFGDPAALARLLTAGALRRRFGRGVARVRGRRDRLRALRALLAVKLDLRGLHRLGVRLEAEQALRLVALMIEPTWTSGMRFAVAYGSPGDSTSYLLIRDGQSPMVSHQAPAGGVLTTLSGPGDAAAAVLSGDRADQVSISGEEWTLAQLRKWIKRAQSG